jgi:hypothetical protein
MKERYKQVLRIQRCIVGECKHEVEVTSINRKWHVRVLLNGEVNQEAVCDFRSDIGFCARSMLRWEDKCGNFSKFALAARQRLNK